MLAGSVVMVLLSQLYISQSVGDLDGQKGEVAAEDGNI
jgi:hypothetical protein